MDAKQVSAFLVDCKPGELINFRMEALGSVFVGPDGKKYRLSFDQLEKGEIAMQQKQTLAEAAAQPAPKPKAKTKPSKRKTQRKPMSTRKSMPKS